MSSTPHSTSTVEQSHPNADVISGLRDAADWLAEHPELPPAYYASISFRSSYAAANAREDLAALAEALGENAAEAQSGAEVLISGTFGPVRVSAAAQVAALAGVPVMPAYEPIIKRAEIPVTPEEDEAWGAAV